MAAGLAATGRHEQAELIVDQLARLQRPDGAVEFSYDLRSGAGDGVLRSGAVAWAGLAAVELRTVTCSHRHDGLARGIARWLLAERISGAGVPGHGLVRGGPDVAWASAEHNLEARAFFARLAALIDGDVASRPGGRHCSGGLDGLSPVAARAFASRLHAAVADLDAAIDHDFVVLGGPDGAHVRQGLGDDARPLDAQALGILWLVGRGRRDDAAAIAANADATMLLGDRFVDLGRHRAGPFVGYRPFADPWGPDVLWMEGTLQMRIARAALGLDTTALDDSIHRWAALTSAGFLLQADRDVEDNPAGEYHRWPAAGPAAWLLLSRGGSTLLR